MTNLEAKILEHARLLAPNCPGNSRHIAFITRRNKIFSIGLNSYKSHRLAAKWGYYRGYVHAELSSIVNFPKNLDITKHTLYVCRIRNSGATGLSFPCAKCRNLLTAFNLKSVKFSTEDNQFDTWY